MNASVLLDALLQCLPAVWNHHAPSTKLHALLKQVARREVEKLFSSSGEKARELKPFGAIIFPYHGMGAVDSLNLFDLDELIIFSFYWVNRERYRRVLDIGANIGLHSIILSRCGYEVQAYEPDPQHFEILRRNLALNRCVDVKAFKEAVSSRDGEMEFVRVLGNTTGSHLVGSKPHPYGDLERFPVRIKSIDSLIAWADLIKLDVEGHENEILLATERDQWLDTDALVEVATESNATSIYDYFIQLGIGLFSQKKNWQRVRDICDMPMSYREGTLFITCKDEINWRDGCASRFGTWVER